MSGQPKYMPFKKNTLNDNTAGAVRSRFHILDIFLLLIPISILLYYLNGGTLVTFIFLGLSIIGISHVIVETTGILARRVSNTISALINATFGNAVEFFIAVFSLQN